jgi:hypothetical protein
MIVEDVLDAHLIFEPYGNLKLLSIMIEQLLTFHKEFHDELKVEPFTSFLKFAQKMNLVYNHFNSSFPSSKSFIHEPLINAFEENELEFLLISPVLRIPRYILYLKGIPSIIF